VAAVPLATRGVAFGGVGANKALAYRHKEDRMLERGNVEDATNGKIIVSRELLGSLLDNLLTRDDPTSLSPHERESLEQLAAAVMSEDEIAISEDLLELWRSG